MDYSTTKYYGSGRICTPVTKVTKLVTLVTRVHILVTNWVTRVTQLVTLVTVGP